MRTAPAVWTDPEGRVWVIYANDCGIAGYVLHVLAGRTPYLTVGWHFGGTRFTTPVVHADRLYVAHPGAVDVFDPQTGHELWSSGSLGRSGGIGAIHWEYPAPSGHTILMTDVTAHLYAFVQR